ncbi:hypothetical protein N9C10_02850 [Flavobacteriaceae bacterium]|nr:hypothetical protein [Flavobacteriaceae bacterium]
MNKVVLQLTGKVVSTNPSYKKNLLKKITFSSPDKYEINKSTKAWVEYYEKTKYKNKNVSIGFFRFLQ